MSVNPITPTPEDLIALSSYLDDELSVSEKQALEQRLSTDEGLRAELESLRETVELVRSLPLLKAPRNFTLDPTVYAPIPKSNTISFISRKTLWRLGTAAGIAASFVLVFAVLLMGGADDASDSDDEQASRGFDQSGEVANENLPADENFEQTAAVAQSTQIALSTTQEAQDGTSRTFAATEVAFGDDESTKATALAFPPALTSQPTTTSQEGEEPSIAAGVDEVRDNTMPPMATQTLVASFDGTQVPDGFIGQTATQLAQNTTLPANSGGGNAQGETGGAVPPVSANMMSSTPSPEPSQTSQPTMAPTRTNTATGTPSSQTLDDTGYSADAPNVPGTSRPESATDAMDDATTDTSTTLGTTDNDDDLSESADAEDDGSNTEASEEDVAAMPPMPDDRSTTLLDIAKYILERLVELIIRISQSMR